MRPAQKAAAREGRETPHMQISSIITWQNGLLKQTSHSDQTALNAQVQDTKINKCATSK